MKMRIHWVMVSMVLVACGDDRLKVADKIAASTPGARVTVGGGKFVNVDYDAAKQADCDDLQRWARDNVKDPPDCVRVQCTFANGSTDLLTSHDGIWEGGSTYLPQCAK